MSLTTPKLEIYFHNVTMANCLVFKQKKPANFMICRLLHLSGGKGSRLESNYSLLPGNEDFLRLIKDLLDAVKVMENSTK
jgi:hypothetical protein